MTTIASLRIKQQEVPAQVLMYLKKVTGDPLSTIQERLKNGEAVVFRNYFGLESIEELNQIYKALVNFGLELDFYRDDEQKSAEFFKNLENMYREIREECETLPD